MLFPISDDDSRLDGPAFVTMALIVANLVVFFLFQQAGGNEAFTYGWSVIPYEIVNGVDLTDTQYVRAQGQQVPIPQAPGPAPIYLTILSAMFMHGGFAHLFGNLLYLWIFGDNVEHRFGALPFLAFYLISGIVATFAQVVLGPGSVIPNLGASGAISGVLGAYLVLFPRNRVHAVFFFRVVAVPAIVVLGLWIALQFFNGFGSIMQSEQTGGVAYGAHIGGFVAGVAMGFIARQMMKKKERPNALTFAENNDGSRRYW